MSKLTEDDLRQFTGTEEYHRWSILFQTCVLSDGAKYVAEVAGAYWLMDAIASYQPSLRKNERLRDFQLWTLKVKDGKGVLTCQEDTDVKPAVTQKFEYTDFPLSEIRFYCNPLDDRNRVIFLPSEY